MGPFILPIFTYGAASGARIGSVLSRVIAASEAHTGILLEDKQTGVCSVIIKLHTTPTEKTEIITYLMFRT